MCGATATRETCAITTLRSCKVITRWLRYVRRECERDACVCICSFPLALPLLRCLSHSRARSLSLLSLALVLEGSLAHARALCLSLARSLALSLALKRLCRCAFFLSLLPYHAHTLYMIHTCTHMSTHTHTHTHTHSADSIFLTCEHGWHTERGVPSYVCVCVCVYVCGHMYAWVVGMSEYVQCVVCDIRGHVSVWCVM